MMTDPRKNGDLHEPATAPATPWSKSELVRQLRDLGVRSGALLQIVGGDKLIIPFC